MREPTGTPFGWCVAVVALATGVAAVHAQPRLGAVRGKPVVAHLPFPETDGPGWTPLVPSPDSLIVYVSSSTGDDLNSGFSPAQAKRTVAAACVLLRDGFPDWVLLKRGDVWSEAFPQWTKSGRRGAEPMVIGSYGVGARPLLNTGSGTGFFTVADPGPKAHLAITDIHLCADRNAGESPDAGLTILSHWSDVLIENCMIERYAANIVIQEVSTGRPSNIRVRRCVIVDAFRAGDAHSQGIFAGAIDGLLVEECIFDNNGWRRGVSGAQANIFNHNMYLHESCTAVVVRGNISARGSATGILQRCGGISEGNLLLQNPVAIFFGTTDQPGITARGAVRNNVILDARDIASDSPRGFGIWLGAACRSDVYGNIVAHQHSGSANVNAFTLEGDMVSVPVYQNFVYDWTVPNGTTGTAFTMNLSTAHGVTFADNVLQQPRGGFLIEMTGQPAADSGPLFGRNTYFTANNPPNQFYYGTDYPGWIQRSAESWSTLTVPNFPAPERTIETYMGSLGLTSSVDAFLVHARAQERNTWDPSFEAGTVNGYIRQGFGVSIATCRADFNKDGTVNILDLAAFFAAVQAGDPRADFNLDGVIDQNDQVLFESVMATGCP